MWRIANKKNLLTERQTNVCVQEPVSVIFPLFRDKARQSTKQKPPLFVTTDDRIEISIIK